MRFRDYFTPKAVAAGGMVAVTYVLLVLLLGVTR